MVTYSFVKFTVNGVDYPGTLSGSTEQLTLNVTMDVTIVAVYQIASYVLNLSQAGQGSTTPAAGSYPYSSDTAVTLTATPAQGWKFSYWIVDGSQVTTNPLNLQMTGNHTVQAVFTAIAVRTITIQAPVGQGTTVQPTGTYSALDGDVVQITAMPASGWQFDHWNGVTGSGNPLTFTVSANVTVQAVFTQIPIPKTTLTISVTGQATSPAPGSAQYNMGDTAHIVATPVSGWNFDHFLLDGVTTIAQATIDILMNADHSLSAVFTAIPPTDQLVLTQGDYQVWQSAANGSYYVKKADAIVASDFATVQDAVDWINIHPPNLNLSGLLIPVMGIVGAVLLSGGGKKK